MDVIIDEVEGVDQEVSEKFPKKYRVIQKKLCFPIFWYNQKKYRNNNYTSLFSVKKN